MTNDIKIVAVHKNIFNYGDTGAISPNYYDNSTHKNDPILSQITLYFANSKQLKQ